MQQNPAVIEAYLGSEAAEEAVAEAEAARRGRRLPGARRAAAVPADGRTRPTVPSRPTPPAEATPRRLLPPRRRAGGRCRGRGEEAAAADRCRRRLPRAGAEAAEEPAAERAESAAAEAQAQEQTSSATTAAEVPSAEAQAERGLGRRAADAGVRRRSRLRAVPGRGRRLRAPTCAATPTRRGPRERQATTIPGPRTEPPSAEGTPLLELRSVEVAYGGIVALKGIDLEVRQGEIVALLGANGAGKTTTLRTVSGLLRPRSGEVLYAGEALTGIPAHKIVQLGIGHSPEGRRIFSRMTVLENLQMGAYRFKSVSQKDLDQVFELFPRLHERRTQLGGNLSGGEQQMLAIGRAMMGQP